MTKRGYINTVLTLKKKKKKIKQISIFCDENELFFAKKKVYPLNSTTVQYFLVIEKLMRMISNFLFDKIFSHLSP